MKLADFNALCEREHADCGGIVDQVSMSPEACAELTADVLSGPERQDLEIRTPDGAVHPMDSRSTAVLAGARVTHLANPAVSGVQVPVLVFRSDDFDVPARARVLRWVDC